jgi:tRNA threonylcarbamoyladenosine biosynthesis protein TsaE
MGMKTVRTNSLEETFSVAGDVLHDLGIGEQSTVLALYGDLGAGKTSLVQGVANTLGIVETVNSPTFVIMKEYVIPEGVWKRLVHVDAYRMNIPRDLELFEWNEIVADPYTLVCIEWPELFVEFLPEQVKKINFKFINEKIREISY